MQEINRGLDIRQWCEAFEKHELVEILVNISATDAQFQSSLGQAFVADTKWCKIRALNENSEDTKFPTEAELSNYFSQFGEVTQVEMVNFNQSKNRNGLITFKEYSSAQAVVSMRVHEITIMNPKDKTKETLKLCCCYAFENPFSSSPSISSLACSSVSQDNGTQNQNGNAEVSPSIPHSANRWTDHSDGKAHIDANASAEPLEKRRIFVSSLSYATNDETLINVYSQYGELEDCIIVREKTTGKSKGYGQGAINALEQSEKIIDGRRTR
ncbi:Heterogeneous nuclear ribonucleoprotein A1, partial [Reticulomyxa filosa]